jgi:hypothetical protein
VGEQLLIVNGINGETGEYFTSPITASQLADVAKGGLPDRAMLAEQQQVHFRASEPDLAPREGVDPTDLAQTGWAVVFPADVDPALIDALRPLVEHRRSQVGDERRIRILSGDQGYRAGESKLDFLLRVGASPAGPADPELFPYYILLVGDPDQIPFSLQYHLDVQYAVGRLDLANVEAYSNYANSVVAAERRTGIDPMRAAFFGTRHDQATELSATRLVEPVLAALGDSHPSVELSSAIGDPASKGRLQALTGGADTPDLLFLAAHGLGLPYGSPEQLRQQGSLVCQDWPGPGHAVTTEHAFGAGDVLPAGDATGLVAFLFACFGAGTPRWDDFVPLRGAERQELAQAPFVSALPKELLGRAGGAALAVVGHVERAWSYSFAWDGDRAYTAVFEDVVRRLIDGHPVGSALEPVNARHAELAVDLEALLEEIGDVAIDRSRLVGLWTAKNDARNFVVLGDPAVRLSSGRG